MVDIRIIEVPFGWDCWAFEREVRKSDNMDKIKLIHVPSGTEYLVDAPPQVIDTQHATELRAKARIRFIHELHGESWLNL